MARSRAEAAFSVCVQSDHCAAYWPRSTGPGLFRGDMALPSRPPQRLRGDPGLALEFRGNLKFTAQKVKQMARPGYQRRSGESQAPGVARRGGGGGGSGRQGQRRPAGRRRDRGRPGGALWLRPCV
ncbi:hypothetical protein AAFF_G00093390 [Aldrovandia affinis]|uniref:Uncharacterized protein n=1 Tax=Aldrovandia affinis TaxID=143900 RepID=A0AAD7T3I3_9TELE|nr:hypothetical protein AAFF_G00093390 [Aldrovandia affinis]